MKVRSINFGFVKSQKAGRKKVAVNTQIQFGGSRRKHFESLPKNVHEKNDLPDLNARDVQYASIKIQSVFKGHRARKRIFSTHGAGETNIVVENQTEIKGDDLPDLESKEVQDATIKIQSVFKGFRVRKKASAQDTMKRVVAVKTAKKQIMSDDLPDLNSKDVQAATLKIQSAFNVPTQELSYLTTM